MHQTHSNEHRTQWVVGITLITMVVEIGAGIITGSMALLADGIHMGSHTVALTISWIAYILARKFQTSGLFRSGTGKILTLSGYTSGLLLLIFAVIIGYQSVSRLYAPVSIQYDNAIIVAVVGLVVNLLCAIILHRSEEHSDYNQKAAYLHVLADAITSVAAITGLLISQYFHIKWIDPAIGILGSLIIIRWSFSLLKSTALELLDVDLRKKQE